jgi:hypothetical protein
MRKIRYLLFLFIFSTSLLLAQKSEIGFTMSVLSNNSVYRFRSIEDDADYTAGKSASFGFTYLKPLNNWLDIETGIEYFIGNASIISIVPTYNGLTDYYHNGSVSLINIPVGVRANFLKYCFVNGGVLFGIDVSKDSPINSQTGLGVQLGAGLKYDFKTGISLFVNPYIKIHSLIPGSFNDYNLRLFESAFRFGMTYRL